MKDNLEKIIQSARSANLRPEEKASIRASLLHKINNTPVSSPFWSFAFTKSYHYYVPAFMILFIFVSGGTSYFAHNSLPGDALYPMKINVNENLEYYSAFTDRQVAEVVAIQATRRLDEAELLAVKGALKVEQNEAIKNSFSKKVVALNNTFAKMEEKGEIDSALEVLSMFDNKVKDKLNVLSNISNDKGEVSIASDIALFITERHEGPTIISTGVSEDARTMAFSAAMATSVDSGNDSEKAKDAENDSPAPTLMMAIEAPDKEVATGTSTSTKAKSTSTSNRKEKTEDSKDLENTFRSTIRWEWRHED